MSTLTSTCDCGCHGEQQQQQQQPGPAAGSHETNNDRSPNNAGSGSPAKDVSTTQESPQELLARAAQEVLENLSQDDDVLDHVKSFAGSVLSVGGNTCSLPRVSSAEPSVPPEYRIAERRIRKALDLLRADAEEGWDRAKPLGRLNVQRWVSTQDSDRAFDAWRDRKGDAGDLEVVILLDRSSSMSWEIQAAAASLWAVKRGLDAIGARSTVLTFNHRSNVLYHADERAKAGTFREPDARGSTDPSEAIAQAARIFAGSNKGQKVLITITDGCYWGTTKPDGCNNSLDEIVQRMGEGGAITAQCLFGFTEWDDYHDKHGHQINRAVANAPALIDFVNDIVKAAIASRMR